VSIRLLMVPADNRAAQALFSRLHEVRERSEHPHAARVINYGWDARQDAIFVLMEALDGETLTRFLAHRGPVGSELGLRVMWGIADAMRASHAAALYHGGLSPDHIIVSSRGDPKIVDLGIAGIALDPDRVHHLPATGPAAWKTPVDTARESEADVQALARLADALSLVDEPTSAAAGGLGRAQTGAARGFEKTPPSPRDSLAEVYRRAVDGSLPSPTAAEFAAAVARTTESPPPPLAARELRSEAIGHDEREAAGPKRVESADRRGRGLLRLAAAVVLSLALATGAVIMAAARDGAEAPAALRSPTLRSSPGERIEGTTMPRVRGLRVQRARSVLQDALLIVAEVVRVEGIHGVVVRSDPTRGEALAAQSGVTLFVGSGA
jgi:protein kinase-like protein